MHLDSQTFNQLYGKTVTVPWRGAKLSANSIYFSNLLVGSLDEISKSDITKATVLQEQPVTSNRQQSNQNTSV